MIKIAKTYDKLPISLIPPYLDLFHLRTKIPQQAKTTHGRRLELINNKKYTDTVLFNSRYKTGDIKLALTNLYHNKCAFCESRVEQYHVEHYRPKIMYYWLAYSWDNLILACPTCNQCKGTNFELEGVSAEFESTDLALRNINSCSSTYDTIEKPLMINPEVTEPQGKIQFNKHGAMSSKDNRFAYTIRICKLDRKFLNDARRKIIDTLKNDIRSSLIENTSLQDQEVAIRTIVLKFIRELKDLETEFLAFRQFIIDNGWLNQLIKGMN